MVHVHSINVFNLNVGHAVRWFNFLSSTSLHFTHDCDLRTVGSIAKLHSRLSRNSSLRVFIRFGTEMYVRMRCRNIKSVCFDFLLCFFSSNVRPPTSHTHNVHTSMWTETFVKFSSLDRQMFVCRNFDFIFHTVCFARIHKTKISPEKCDKTHTFEICSTGRINERNYY